MTDDTDHYKRAAEIVYVQNRQMHEFSLKMQAEYGKWLVSSLLFLHRAAIGGLLFKATGASAPVYLLGLWWFVLESFSLLRPAFQRGGIFRLGSNNIIFRQIFNAHQSRILAQTCGKQRGRRYDVDSNDNRCSFRSLFVGRRGVGGLLMALTTGSSAS